MSEEIQVADQDPASLLHQPTADSLRGYLIARRSRLMQEVNDLSRTLGLPEAVINDDRLRCLACGSHSIKRQ